ncbi:AsnC family transcriptional regulator [Pectinatus brassicae]|uniref:siroheme decarboxylase n=1 Tax=Pectinatus brassicae TaxID=862415 RepID=A0A840UDN2_9FIRM|nr:AsnC family transcriptional regulator [Pectinatus brassicae]MBB5335831.1 DNA-binding Lrp family transcriptional regulator [Pectinatus brassicae]
MLTLSDKKILNAIQTNLPLTPQPFADLGKIIGLSEQEVIERLNKLKQAGYIRRVGPFFDSAKLGYSGTLVALKVKEGYMKQVASAINNYEGATHNYERKGKYNLWFTLLTHSEQDRDEILSNVRKLPGVEAAMNLVSRKKYKVNVKFNLK